MTMQWRQYLLGALALVCLSGTGRQQLVRPAFAIAISED